MIPRFRQNRRRWQISMLAVVAMLVLTPMVPALIGHPALAQDSDQQFGGTPLNFGDLVVVNRPYASNGAQLALERFYVDRGIISDPYLSAVLIDHCEQMLLRRRGNRPSFHSRVENAVSPLLPRGKAQAGNVARELGVSSRTFARRLAAEGLTFSGVVQKLRGDLARRYLADDKLSISQIAWMLGYREVGAFSHAFKRQTGQTPREARTQIGKLASTRRA